MLTLVLVWTRQSRARLAAAISIRTLVQHDQAWL